ncbi:MAG: amino acid ABC transporter permease, partial [Desulfatirhabdiaceae bacterium]|nr:amino acid ABC transporter permease [Desulfatirhabdiaceae bacterium]
MNSLSQKAKNKIRFFRNPSPLVDVLKYLAVVLAFIWLIGAGTEKLGYNWQWYRVPRYIFTFEDGHLAAGPLIQGLMVTFQVAGISLLLSFAIGLAAALFRLS